ncbi:hypothetical protein MHYP_G00304820 [Metynnis hypsauchen]
MQLWWGVLLGLVEADIPRWPQGKKHLQLPYLLSEQSVKQKHVGLLVCSVFNPQRGEISRASLCACFILSMGILLTSYRCVCHQNTVASLQKREIKAESKHPCETVSFTSEPSTSHGRSNEAFNP